MSSFVSSVDPDQQASSGANWLGSTLVYIPTISPYKFMKRIAFHSLSQVYFTIDRQTDKQKLVCQSNLCLSCKMLAHSASEDKKHSHISLKYLDI